MIPGQRPYIHWQELRGAQVRGLASAYTAPARDPAARSRDAELVMLFTGGASMAEIARVIGLSRERVRQRLKRMGYTGKDQHGWKSTEPWIAQHRRRAAKDAAREARFQADAVKLRALADQLGYTPTCREAARALGAPEGIWRGSGSGAWLAFRGGRQQNRGPYAPYTRRLYAAAGLMVRAQGDASRFGPRTPRTHCLRGHEFTPENTYVWKGHRSCRTCHRARGQASYQRRKAQKAAA